MSFRRRQRQKMWNWKKRKNNRPGAEPGRNDIRSGAVRTALSAAALLLAMNVLTACAPAPESAGEATEPPAAAEVPGVRVIVDGESRPAAPDGREKTAGLWVTVSVDGAVVAELPFGEKHTVQIEQDGTGENILALTGEAVFMQDADCPGKDCVLMGEVTRENLETRVLGGFIICLPHRLAVEVWEKE